MTNKILFKAAQFVSHLLSTFCTASGRVMVVCRTPKWRIVWKARRLCIVWLGRWPIRQQVSMQSIHHSSLSTLIVEDLRLFLTSVLGQEPWKYDSKVVPIPWRPAEEEAIKLKIPDGLTLGYYACDAVVSVSFSNYEVFKY